MRYFIAIQYLGKNYAGWQRQINALSVQECIEAALEKILSQKIEITGSGRTDTGVNAAIQWAHFDVSEPIQDLSKLKYKLNAVLPADISIRELISVADDVHARFSASLRGYHYVIYRGKNPFLTELCYEYDRALDVGAMNQAAALLLQHTDFESFSKVKTEVNNFNCTITEARWQEQGDYLIFNIKANRFLRGMVRAIVGTLIEVGLGKLSVQDFKAIIAAKHRSSAKTAAPAQGLYLSYVEYPDECRVPLILNRELLPFA